MELMENGSKDSSVDRTGIKQGLREELSAASHHQTENLFSHARNSAGLAEQGIIGKLSITDEGSSTGKEKKVFSPRELSQDIELIRTAGSLDGTTVLRKMDSGKSNKFIKMPGVDADIPVVFVGGMEPGSLGVLIKRDKSSGSDSSPVMIPFIAGRLADNAGPKKDIIVMNDAAAAKLQVTEPKAAKSKASPSASFDVINFVKDGEPLPATFEELQRRVQKKTHDFASHPEVIEKAKNIQEGKDKVGAAYVPKPDSEFGYRRTDRSAAELNKLRNYFLDEAKNNWTIAESVKPDSKNSEKTIANIRETAEKEKQRLQLKQNEFSTIEAALSSGKNVAVSAGLPEDLQRALIALANGGKTEDALRTQAIKLAQHYEDLALLQDRIISDASNPKFAQQLLQHRFAMKAYAAEVMAANPDMAANVGTPGALAGTRHVINSGHDPMHGSSTPGFGKFPWSKGMEEYDFNKETSAIQGYIIEYSGGVPIYVNQDELFRTDPEAQDMSGLGAAMVSHHADTAIANHVDDDKGIPAGTLTMVDSQSGGSQSVRLGKWIDIAKGSVSGEPSKGVRDIRDRGVQRASHGGALALNEILSTSAKDRGKLMNPFELAKLQMGLVIGIDRYLHPPTDEQISGERKADESKSRIGWDKYWQKQPKPTVPTVSLIYPRMK